MKTNNDLTAEIVALYDAIVDRVAGLRQETSLMVKAFRQEQKELQEKLKGNLAKGESLRKADFESLMSGIIQKRKEREEEIVGMLEQFKKEEEEITLGLRRLLDKDNQVRLKDLKNLLARLHSRQKERSAEVEELRAATQDIKQEAREMIAELKKEREETVNAWRSLAQTMQRKRAIGTFV